MEPDMRTSQTDRDRVVDRLRGHAADGRLEVDELEQRVPGASGYVLKHSAGEELMRAIHEVLEGRVYLTPLLTKDVITTLMEPSTQTAVHLTPRQLEVLRLIADGRRMKEIAATLQLSTRTAETHKYQMMRALGVDSTAALVRYAIQLGLVAH